MTESQECAIFRQKLQACLMAAKQRFSHAVLFLLDEYIQFSDDEAMSRLASTVQASKEAQAVLV